MTRDLSRLPYDILRILVRFLSGADIAQLFATCKCLYAYMTDDAIWQELCAGYRITDKDLFAGATFFEVYSQILHKYGPLLGLWASDHPYHGSIIEFRVDMDAHNLCGEIWQFHAPHSAHTAIDSFHPTPYLPTRITLVTAALPPAPTPRRAHLLWHTAHDVFQYTAPLLDGLDPAAPTLRVLSQTDESLFISSRSGTSRLPDFPAVETPWYDDNRGLPRIPVEPAPRSAAQEAEPTQLDSRFVYMARTDATKPAALAIYPSLLVPIDVFAPHEPMLDIEIARLGDLSMPYTGEEPIFHRRFYPLRIPQIVGCFPTDQDWQPASLEGIWLGSYRTCETEVLYVYLDKTTEEIRAMKITGNMNVPRGAISWSFRVEDRVRWHELPLDDHKAQLAFGAELAAALLFRGTGTTSEIGYLEHDREQGSIFVGVIGPDVIRINWYDMDEDYTPQYRRYKGRGEASDVY